MTNLAFLKVLTLSSITAGGESQSALKLSEMKGFLIAVQSNRK